MPSSRMPSGKVIGGVAALVFAILAGVFAWLADRESGDTESNKYKGFYAGSIVSGLLFVVSLLYAIYSAFMDADSPVSKVVENPPANVAEAGIVSSEAVETAGQLAGNGVGANLKKQAAEVLAGTREPAEVVAAAESAAGQANQAGALAEAGASAAKVEEAAAVKKAANNNARAKAAAEKASIAEAAASEAKVTAEIEANGDQKSAQQAVNVHGKATMKQAAAALAEKQAAETKNAAKKTKVVVGLAG